VRLGDGAADDQAQAHAVRLARCKRAEELVPRVAGDAGDWVRAAVELAIERRAKPPRDLAR
jgi:hypothetical protein